LYRIGTAHPGIFTVVACEEPRRPRVLDRCPQTALVLLEMLAQGILASLAWRIEKRERIGFCLVAVLATAFP